MPSDKRLRLAIETMWKSRWSSDYDHTREGNHTLHGGQPMSRGIVVLLCTVVALVCTAVIVLAIRPELLVVIALMLEGAA